MTVAGEVSVPAQERVARATLLRVSEPAVVPLVRHVRRVGAEQTLADIQGFVRTKLSAHEYPREVAFLDTMPMTTTGKVIRRLLRERA